MDYYKYYLKTYCSFKSSHTEEVAAGSDEKMLFAFALGAHHATANQTPFGLKTFNEYLPK